MAQKDFRKNPPQDAFANLKKQQEEEKKKLSLNTVEVEVNGTKYTIKKWNSVETFELLPQFLNLWFAPSGAAAQELAIQQETLDLNPNASGDWMVFFCKQFLDLEFVEYLQSHLGNVFVKGSKDPVVFENLPPQDILQLFLEVADANFMMQLCQTISLMPQKMLLSQTESAN